MILDTNAISSLFDGDQSLNHLLVGTSHHHLPVIVIAEYLFGLRSSRKGSRLQSFFRQLEADSVILFPDRQTADWYVTIRSDLKHIGRPIPENDLWIAALARQHDLEIVSQDKHFDLVKDLRRLGW